MFEGRYITQATISTSAVQAVLSGVVDETETFEVILQECGLTSASIYDGPARIPATDFTRLAKAIISHTQDESLRLFPRKVSAGSFFMAGTIAVHCPTIESALDRIARFYSLLDCGVRFEFSRVRDGASIRLVAEDASLIQDNVIFEIYLTALHRFAVWLAGHPLTLRSVSLSGRPRAYGDAYERIFTDVPVHVGAQENSFLLGANCLEMPVVRSEADFFSFQRQHASYLFAPLERESELTATIRSRVAAELMNGRPPPTLSDIADAVGLLPRKIARQLSVEGLCFREVTAVARRDISFKFLADSALPLEEVAEQAGYSELSAFSRAFKSWTGVTPSGFRKVAVNINSSHQLSQTSSVV